MKTEMKIFLVEDDIWYAEILEYHLSLNPDYKIFKFNSANECLKNLGEQPDVICTDFSMPDTDGFDFIKTLENRGLKIPVIVISGQDDVETAISMLQHPLVHDYLVKDDDTKDRLWKSIMHLRETYSLKAEVKSLKKKLKHSFEFEEKLKGNSEGLKKTFSLMHKACHSNITVSINGETGTGKEVVAQCIHYNSARAKKNFIPVNVTAIPKDLLESELFGHEKGAFTGAHNQRIGKFEEANKGTLFLDEIADMDLNLQAKLLRVLQEQEITRIGSNKTIKIDVRIIVASHKDLAEAVKAGTFRQDLYYRLLGLPIVLSPLRERKEDIMVLANHFSNVFAEDNKITPKKFSKEAKNKLIKHSFPGNIRELKAVIDLAMVMSDGDEISSEDVQLHNHLSMNEMLSESKTLKDYTNVIIKHHLDKYDNDVAKVAGILDIGKSTLYKMIQRKDLIL